MLTEMTYTIKPVVPDRTLTVRADNPPFELGDFTVTIAGTTLTAVPRVELDDLDVAKQMLQPYLADLEAEWDLQGFPLTIEFSSGHQISQTADGEPGRHELVLTSSVSVSSSVAVSATVTFGPPSGAYKATPTVDVLRHRWLSHARRVTELPASAAYSLLTFLERLYGDRKAVAGTLNVSMTVLDKVGRLSAVSDPYQGRKFTSSEHVALRPEELGWLATFVELVGKRAAAYESGQRQTTPLTMAELPALP